MEEVIRVQEEGQFYVSPVKYGRVSPMTDEIYIPVDSLSLASY